MLLDSISSHLKLAGLMVPAFRKKHVEGYYKKWQGDRLRLFVRYAYENIPFYRRKYDEAGIRPEDIRSLEDIGKLPLITKNDLRTAPPEDLISRSADVRRQVMISTSGSTGAPVRLFRSRRLMSLAPLEFLLGLVLMPKILGAWAGERIGKKILLILPEDEAFEVYLIVRKTLNYPAFLRNSLRLLNTAESPRDQLRTIEAFRPDVIGSDVMALSNIAVIARREGLTVPRVKLLMIGGELVDDRTRHDLARTFGAVILEHYGATEVGTIAFECSAHQGLHILWQSVLVEILKDGRPAPPGIPGEIVVTNLWNKLCPMIRYSGLSDVGALFEERCACGSLRPRLKLLQGRRVDSFRLPDGRMIHPFSLTLALEHIPGIGRFQIIQDISGRVKVNIVPDKPSGAALLGEESKRIKQAAAANLRKVLGDEIGLDVELINDEAIPSVGRSLAPVVRSFLTNPEAGHEDTGSS